MIKCKLAYKQHKIKHFIFISLEHAGGGGGGGGVGCLNWTTCKWHSEMSVYLCGNKLVWH